MVGRSGNLGSYWALAWTNVGGATSLAEKDINVLAIYQSIRQVDVRIVIAEDHYEAAISALHYALIENTNTTKISKLDIA